MVICSGPCDNLKEKVVASNKKGHLSHLPSYAALLAFLTCETHLCETNLTRMRILILFVLFGAARGGKCA